MLFRPRLLVVLGAIVIYKYMIGYIHSALYIHSAICRRRAITSLRLHFTNEINKEPIKDFAMDLVLYSGRSAQVYSLIAQSMVEFR